MTRMMGRLGEPQLQTGHLGTDQKQEKGEGTLAVILREGDMDTPGSWLALFLDKQSSQQAQLPCPRLLASYPVMPSTPPPYSS